MEGFPKIIHTSDLHLSEDKPETLDALNIILELATMHKVDLVTIAGDIFNTAEDAEGLRPLLRSKFSNLDFEIIAIPGNHDLDAYAGNLNFGSDLTLVIDKPYQVLRRKNVSIVAVPYVDRPDEELLRKLREEAEKSESSVLLLHCTLDIGCKAGDFGEEQAHYFPISMGVIESLGFDHVLAGHFHRTPQLRKIKDKGYFVYPGSPVSLSKSEVGKRGVILLDDWEKPLTVYLDSFYYDAAEFFVSPEDEERVLGEIGEWYSARCDDNCKLMVTVDGYTTLDETLFEEQIKQVCEKAEHMVRFRDVSKVVNHPLYLGFLEKLKGKEVESPELVQRLVMDAMVRLLRPGEIRG